MTIFSLIAFNVSIVCLVLGFIILFRDRRNRSHRLFFLICLSLSCLNMVYIPAYASADKTGVMFWTEIAAWFVNPFYAVNLHFYIDLVFKKRLKLWKLLLIYAPPVLINIQFLISPHSILDYVRYNGEWKLIPEYGNFRFYIASGYVLVYAAVAVFIIILYLRRADTIKEKKQAVWLVLNLVVSTFIGAAGLWIVPYFNFKIPNIGPTYHLFYVAGLFYSVYNFRFMNLNPSIVADEIISHINDMVILLNSELRIVSINISAIRSLGFSQTDLTGKYFPDMVCEKDFLIKKFHDLESGTSAGTSSIIRYKTAREAVITDSYFAAVKDRFNDIIGFLVISKENRGRREFGKIYKITEREQEIVDLTLSGLSSSEIGKLLGISNRTVQSHQEHIYQKLGAAGKVDLIKIAAVFNLEEKK